MVKLAVSLLDMDYSCFGRELVTIEEAGLEIAHIDVMDGQFVPSLGIGTAMIRSLRKATKLFFDVHLMVERPERFIELMAAAGADRIIIHQEACADPAKILREIKKTGKQAGICLRPETPLDVLSDEILALADMVLLMTTVPGVEGQSFIPSSPSRIGQLKSMITNGGYKTLVEVDGGINAANLEPVSRAGADIAVAGRSLVLGDMEQNIRKLREIPGVA